MKTFLTSIIAILSPILIFGQNILDGKYCLSIMGECKKKVEVECITFQPNNRFESQYSFFEFEYGFGNYNIKNDSLILQYDSCPPKIKNKLGILDSLETSGDSAIIEIQFHYELEEFFRVDIIEIAVTKSENFEKGYCLVNSLIDADSLKTYKYKYLKQNGQLFLKLRGLVITPSVFIIDGSTNYRFVCYLYNPYYGRIDGVTKRYSVVKNNRNWLNLGDISFDGLEIISKYKRKK